MSYLQTALKVVKQDDAQKTESKIRLIEKQTPRTKSIEDILDAILFSARDRISEAYKGKQYHATDEIRGIENEIDRLYKAVLKNQASLSDFQNACERWFLICKEGLGNRTQN